MDDLLSGVVALVGRRAAQAQDGPVEVDPDTALADLGLTSLELVGLMLEVESEFGVSLGEEALVADTFRTPRTLAGAVAVADRPAG